MTRSNQPSDQLSNQPSNQPRKIDSSGNERAEQERESIPDDERTLGGRPADPNRTGAGKQFPPGVKPEDVWDPGNATPDAPPVDNESGRRD